MKLLLILVQIVWAETAKSQIYPDFQTWNCRSESWTRDNLERILCARLSRILPQYRSFQLRLHGTPLIFMKAAGIEYQVSLKQEKRKRMLRLKETCPCRHFYLMTVKNQRKPTTNCKQPACETSTHSYPRMQLHKQHIHHSLVFVYDGVEQLAIPPACGEVFTADVLIAVWNPLGPEQQLLFCSHVFWLTIDLDVWNLRWCVEITMLETLLTCRTCQ